LQARSALILAQHQEANAPRGATIGRFLGVELPPTREAMTVAGAVRVTALQATVQCGTGPKPAAGHPAGAVGFASAADLLHRQV